MSTLSPPPSAPAQATPTTATSTPATATVPVTARTEAIPEHDKLGPLAPPASARPASLRAIVLAAVDEVLAPARAARDRVAADPTASVHDVRKAIRRTRAIVDLVAAALPRRERKDLRAALVAARRTLGPARDLTVASEALVEVAAAPDLAPAAAAIVAAARADAPSIEAVADDVARAVEVALAQGESLAAALPDELRPRALVRGLIATYKRARQARRQARRSDRAVHRWRRRSKELSHQLAVLREVPACDELRRDLATLDDDLGHVVDRLMLKDFVGLYGHAAGVDAVSQLLTQLHDEFLDRRDQARKDSKALFAPRPRKLRRRLRRAIAAASTPAEPGDGDGDSEGDGDGAAST